MRTKEEIINERKKNIESLKILISELDFKEFISFNFYKYVYPVIDGQRISRDIKSDYFFARDEFIFGLMGALKYSNKNYETSNDFHKVDENAKIIFQSYAEEFLLEVKNLNKMNFYNKFLGFQYLGNLAHFFYVRGDYYIAQMKDLAYLLYSPFDNLLTKNLGFTIEDAFKFSNDILNISSQRFNELFKVIYVNSTNEFNLAYKDYVITHYGNDIYKKLEEINEKYFPDIIKIYQKSNTIINMNEIENYLNKIGGMDKLESNFRKLLYKNKNNFGLKIEDFGYTKDTLIRFKNFLKRFSFECGTINNSYSSVLDFNEFLNKPIISIEGEYFIPIPAQLPWTIVNSIFYDLIDNKENLTIKSFRTKTYTGNFGQIRGYLIEDKTVTLLEKLINKENIFTNILHSKKEDGESDIIVVDGDTLLLLECKGKRLTFKSKFGDRKSLIDDLNKSIKFSFDQINKTLRLLETQPLVLENEFKKIKIKRENFRYIFKIIITDNIFANLSTNPIFLNSKDLPVVFCIYDFDIILSEFKRNIDFYLYLLNRTSLNNWGFFISTDEKDLLAYYQNNSFSFENKIKLNKLWIVEDQCKSLDEKYTYLDNYYNPREA